MRDLVGPLFRRKRLLLSVFAITLLIAGTASFFVPPPYKSQMAVLVNRERLDPLVTTEPTSQPPSNAASEVTVEEINSEAELLLSQDLLQKVVVATGLNKKTSLLDFLYPAANSEEMTERAVKKLAHKIKVKNETNSNMIEVTYMSDDPRLSYAVLNSLGTLYVEKHAAVHRPPGSYNFFALQTDKYRQLLAQSELNLKKFSEETGVSAPDIERSDLALQVATSVGQEYGATQAIAADTERINNDIQQMKTIPKRAATQETLAPPDKLLEDLGASLLALQARRAQLALKYDPAYPLVAEADEELAQAHEAISKAEKTRYLSQTSDVDPTYELLREDLAKTYSDLAAQKATQVASRASAKGIRRQMVDLTTKMVSQQDLIRETKANEDNYLLYLAKREQERTSDALDKTRIGNVAIAVPPSIPVLPLYSIPIALLISFGSSVILSVGAAYCADYLDPSFKTPGEVMDTLNIPVVISMPRRAVS